MPRRSCGGLPVTWPSSPTRCVAPGAGGSRWLSRAPQPLGSVLRVSVPAQVAEAKGKADEARLRAQAALDKANETRALVESSNKELRELISHIKAFLSRECWRAGGLAAPAQPCVALHLHHTALTLHRTAPHCMVPALHVGCTTPAWHGTAPHHTAPAPCCVAWSLPCPKHPVPPSHPLSPLPCPTLPPRGSALCCPSVRLSPLPQGAAGDTLTAPTRRGGG